MTWDFQQCDMSDQQSLRSACANVQSDQSLYLLLEYSTTPRLLTEQHLEFLSWTGGCTGSFESTLVKMPHWWKSHVMALMIMVEYASSVSSFTIQIYWSVGLDTRRSRYLVFRVCEQQRRKVPTTSQNSDKSKFTIGMKSTCMSFKNSLPLAR